MEYIVEGPEVVSHGEDLDVSPWAVVSTRQDFKQRIDGV